MSIQISKLLKEFPDGSHLSTPRSSKKVLNIGSTSLRENEITVIIGRNGSGKTTLLNCIGGLLPFEEGTIEVNISGINYNLESGNRLSIPREARTKIGYIFQQKALWNHLSALDNIVHPLTKVHKLARKDAVERAKHYLNLLGVKEEKHDEYPSQLSGGQQRKVAIARTLSVERDLLLIDELEANLDQTSARIVMDVIREEYVERHKTVLIISHSMELLEQFYPNIVLLEKGDVCQSSSGATELLEKKDLSKEDATIIKDVIDASSSKSFLARQSLQAAINISTWSVNEKDINKLFSQIGIEISGLISMFQSDNDHLLLIATKAAAIGTGATEVRIRAAEKSSGFILNGKEASKLKGFTNIVSYKDGEYGCEFKVNHRSLLESARGFNLEMKKEAQQSEHSSLMDAMFETNGEIFEYQYTSRHPKIKGACNIAIPIPSTGHPMEHMSYYEFSTNTRNVYLIGCTINKTVKGIISIDSSAAKKWPDFVIQQLTLIGNIVAIAIDSHEEKTGKS
jgi:ABC-type polar amino acid transport system ATPase subunit